MEKLGGRFIYSLLTSLPQLERPVIRASESKRLFPIEIIAILKSKEYARSNSVTC
jgi:hypothetical protein